MQTTLSTLSADDLDRVTGGAGASSTSGGTRTSGGSGDLNDQLLTTLQGLQRSIKELSSSNKGLFGSDNALLFMTVALAMRRRSEVVIYGRRGYWRSW